MRHCRELEHTPGLFNLKLTDDVRSNQIAGDTGRPVTYKGVCDAVLVYDERRPARKCQVRDVRLVVLGRVLQRDGARDTVAKLGRVSNLVHTGDMVAAARKGIRAASRIALPRRVEDRSRATEREPSELDERVVQTELGAANGAGRAVVSRRPPKRVRSAALCRASGA